MTLVVDVPVNVINLAEARSKIAAWIAEKKRPSAVVVQTNAFSVVTAHENSEYRQSLQEADLSLPDGMPLVWLLRSAGHEQRERVYGPDLMLLLCEQAAREGWKCFLYGGEMNVAAKAAAKLHSLFPSLNIVGCYSPPFHAPTEEEDREIVTRINNTGADILWVALGGPKQDMWMMNHRDRLNVSVQHGVGAAFDILAGSVPQAPRWMMSCGLEWFFRLLVEPRRLWKRYTVKNIRFLYLVFTREFGRRWFHRLPKTRFQ